MNPSPCPCGTALAYAACCGRWHAGTLHLRAPNAEALMRSRYAAFVRGDDDYLRATWAAETCPVDIQAGEPGLRWLGLDVLRHAIIDDNCATVEFVARSKFGGRARRLHETSRFERRGGRWVYVDGVIRA